MKPALNKKLFRSAAMIGLTGAISLSSVGAIFAKDPPENSSGKHGVFGSVTAKSESSFDMKTRAGAMVTFTVTDSTKFRIPGDDSPAFAGIKVGNNLAVLGERSEDGALALHVMVIPNEVRKEHRVLRVVEISGNTIIAEDANGNKVEVKLDHEISSDVKGMLITFIGERSEASNKFKANAEVKIEQVIKRLENLSEKLDAEAKAEANEKVREEKKKESVDVKTRLKANMESHISFFQKLIERAPESAKPSLKEALEKTIAGYRAEMEAIDKLGDQLNETRKLNVIQGTVAEVTADEIKVKVKDEVATIKTNADTKVQINGKDGTLADIKAGNSIMVRYSLDGSVASHIVIKSEVVRNEAHDHGTILSVDSSAHKVSLKNSKGTVIELTLTNATDINMNGKDATEADLKANVVAKFTYNPETMEVMMLSASSMTYVEGTVKSAADNSLTIAGKTGDVTVKVSNDTKVVIRGVLQGLVGITTGMSVVAEYDVLTGVATTVKANEEPRRTEVRLADARGIITNVDSDGHKIALTLSNGSTLVLTVANTTAIDLNGRAADAAGLKANLTVKVVYNPTTMEAIKLSASSMAYAEGKIKAVNSADKTVTITTAMGDISVKVAATTNVFIRGTLQGVIGLVAGMDAVAEYDVTTNVATTIKASTEEPKPATTNTSVDIKLP